MLTTVEKEEFTTVMKCWPDRKNLVDKIKLISTQKLVRKKTQMISPPSRSDSLEVSMRKRFALRMVDLFLKSFDF